MGQGTKTRLSIQTGVLIFIQTNLLQGYHEKHAHLHLSRKENYNFNVKVYLLPFTTYFYYKKHNTVASIGWIWVSTGEYGSSLDLDKLLRNWLTPLRTIDNTAYFSQYDMVKAAVLCTHLYGLWVIDVAAQRHEHLGDARWHIVRERIHARTQAQHARMTLQQGPGTHTVPSAGRDRWAGSGGGRCLL